MSVERVRRAFSTTEYYRMTEAGILSEDDRVELIDGEVIQMSPIGSRHAACVDRLTMHLHRQGSQTFIVRVQSPVQLNDFSVPQPDVSLLRPREDFYSQSHPTPTDVLLVVEVADASVVYDRAVKLPLYARAGITECWLVDLVRNEVEIHTRPEQGMYVDVHRFGRGQQLASVEIPSLALGVEQILG